MSGSKKDPVSKKPRASTPLVLSIRGSAFGGDGLSSHEGKVCFVEGALQGEEVEAEILQEKKEFLRLRATRILKASPHRVEPPCSYYGFCGGCQTQHVSYEEELRMKEAQFADVMRKIGGIETGLLGIIHGKKDYHYRSSATFQVGPARKGVPALFYVSKDNVTPVAVKECILLDKALSGIFNAPPRVTRGSDRLSFRLDEKGHIFSDQDEKFFRIKLAGQSILVNSKGFFQNNLPVTELLCEKISEWVARVTPEIFYDLYAGVGTFSLLCAAGCRKVVCIEENPFAVSALRMNQAERGLSHFEVVCGKVETHFPKVWSGDLADTSLVFLDPPRQGMEKGLAEFMARSCPARAMIYVSCDIATLARDLKVLLAGGQWKLEEVLPFDMFPRTKHLEAAAYLSKI